MLVLVPVLSALAARARHGQTAVCLAISVQLVSPKWIKEKVLAISAKLAHMQNQELGNAFSARKASTFPN